MADLPETSSWEPGIYQIETTDPVVGGPPDLALGQGITNVPPQQLANRTIWLRDQITALQSAVGAAATQADIDAAINALIGGAPAALDTLNELAAALADDANYAATITTALDGKVDMTDLSAAITAAQPQVYVSPETAIPVGTTVSFIHGLGHKPEQIDLYLVCQAASDGYSAGDVVHVGSGETYSGWGMQAYMPDTTQIKVVMGNSGQVVLNPSNGIRDTISTTTELSNWKMKLRAQ